MSSKADKFREIVIKSYDVNHYGLSLTKDKDGNPVLKVKADKFGDFLREYLDWDTIYEEYYHDIEEYHDDQCGDCPERCDTNWCKYVDDLRQLRKDYDALEDRTDPRELALDFYRDDSYIMNIFKAFNPEELTQILKRIGYEQPHICRCKKSKD